MTPVEKEAFIKAFCNNVASVPEAALQKFMDEYCDAGDSSLSYESSEYYTPIMDALGVWFDARMFYKKYFREEEKANV